MEAKAAESFRGAPHTAPYFLEAPKTSLLGTPTMRGAPSRGARSRSSSMVAPAEIPQLTPRRPSAVASVKHEGSSSSSRSSSRRSRRSLSEERPAAPTDRISSFEDPGAPRGPRGAPPYNSSKAGTRELPFKAAAGGGDGQGDGVDSPRSLPERAAESWRQLAPGGGPQRGSPGAPPQEGGPSGPPLNVVVRPGTGPEGGHLYPPSRLSEGREPWRTGEGGGPPSARERGPSPLGAPTRSPRAFMGLPAVPQSPRGSVLLGRGGNGSRTAGEGGGGPPSAFRGPAAPSGGPQVSQEKCGAHEGEGVSLLQQAAAAGLRGVPCPNCRFVVPLQHIALCAEWHIRHAMQSSRPPPAPSEAPLQGAPPGAPTGGMHFPPTSLLQLQQLSKPSKLAAAAADTPGRGYREPQQQQQQHSGYEGPCRGPSVPLPWGTATRALPVKGGPQPEAFPLGHTLGPRTNTRGPPMGGSVWGPVPPSFLSSPFNLHLWAA
ncbi:hypothetical protein Esti_006211 [Eimeria stiedai]